MAYNNYSIDLSSYFADKAIEEAKPDAPGIMKRSRSKAEAEAKAENPDYNPYGFLSKFTSYLSAAFTDEDEAKSALQAAPVGDTRAAQRLEVDSAVTTLGSENLRRTTQKILGGVLDSTSEPVVQAADDPGAAFVKGFMSTAAQMADEEEQVAEAKPTKTETQGAGLMSKPTISTSSSSDDVEAEYKPMALKEDTIDVASADELVQDRIGMTPEQWRSYREVIADIESKGRYSIKGGANDHYDGRYQMGKAAKKDAAELLGFDIGHDAAAREAFRNDPELQEKAFAAFTAQNYKYLMRKSPIFRELDFNEKMGVLGYAHNQGWAGAMEWLETGNVGADAFGTKGTKYYDAVTGSLAG